MTPSSPHPHEKALTNEEFSLVAGGPIYQLLVRTGLLRPPVDLLKRRVAAVLVICWLPLLVLSLVEGRAISGVRIPFLKDPDIQVRLLFSLPIYLMAEKVVHQRLRSYVRYFTDTGVVRGADRERFEGLVATTLRFRNSLVAELGMVVFVYTVGHTLWAEQLAVHGETWFATPAGDALAFTLAGHWFSWVVMPIFQFMLLRWWYRIVLWWVFLVRVARLPLDLVPTHPDHAGGLGFLGTATMAFAPLLVAQTSLVSAMIAGRILHQGARLQDFKVEIASALLFALVQALLPLFAFVPKLLLAQRKGLHDYGLLANRYVRDFDRKWIGGEAPADEELVGTGDIQSLADLEGSYAIVRQMQPLPFGRDVVVLLLVSAALPLLPLVTTVIPLEELLKRLLEAMI